jgi:AraC-like DNA-binding protein
MARTVYSGRMDPLADVLELGRVRGALLANVRARAPWGLALPQVDGASFHAVTSGVVWLRTAGHEPTQLMPGDVLLLPTGAPHRLSSSPDGPWQAFDPAAKEGLLTPDGNLDLPARAGDVDLPGPGALTTFVCAGYTYDFDAAQRLMGLLPEVLHVPAGPAERQVAAIVELLGAEVGTRHPGSRAAAARLIDLLLIAAVRSWAARRDPAAPPSWLTGLGDPTVTRALTLMHERPGEAWTLASLAAAVHVSRATLARRFTAAVGEPPLAYLARWRMVVAARRLRTSDDPIEMIAAEVGYSSEYAFNRAFARLRGSPPGRYRRCPQELPQVRP